MIDREKVIKALTVKIQSDSEEWDTVELPIEQAEEILALLKEQDAEIKRLKRPDCEHAEHDGLGCLGYCGCKQDDQPIEACERCEKYTGNIAERREDDGNQC